MKTSFLIGGASFIAFGALCLWDLLSRTKKKTHKEHRREDLSSIRIVMTGGPCGGKSEGIEFIYRSLKNIGAPIFIVPEAATIIGTSGINLDLSKLAPQLIDKFQIYLMRLQYNMEAIIYSVTNVLVLEKTPIILCDRGLMDGKAYSGEQNWAKILNQVEITQGDILQRYDAIVHMVTAALGAKKNYIHCEMKVDSQQQNEGFKVRKQSPEFAEQLDLKLRKCYEMHPNRYLIHNSYFFKTFEDKKLVLMVQIAQILSQVMKKFELHEYIENLDKGIPVQENDESQKNPYLIRKRKYQKFMRIKTSL